MNHEKQENTDDQEQAIPTPLPQWVEPGPVHPGEPLSGPQQAPAGQATSDAGDINTVGQTPPAPPVRPTPRWVEPVPGERESDSSSS